MKPRPVSEAVEDYVKAIYLLEQSEGKATTKALALALDVAAPSVTAMIKRLHAMRLVRYARYRGVSLTPAGKRMALEVIRHHRLLELYLVETLGLPWDKVHEEAERLEHVISEDLEERISERLGHPIADPHGDPIPTKEGEVKYPPYLLLSDLNPGTAGVIKRVLDQDPAKLRYLGSLGLIPEARVTLLQKAPFGGAVSLEVGKTRCAIGSQLARAIYVVPMESH
jgi:DtxR family Mn-dependent transcriptional regulator